MIGRLIERLFVQVRADMSDLSRDLNQGVAQTRAATGSMSKSWNQVSAKVEELTQNLTRGKITQGQYTAEMNRLASSMKVVAGSYRQAQTEVWGYASAARAAQAASQPVFDTAPVTAFARSTGQARMQMMNLGYQLNDIGMTLATGQNPMTVMIQQGSQIAQIYAGQGGVKQAFSDISRILTGLAARAWPIALIGGAFLGLQHEINETTDVAVSFGDTFKAVFQVLYGYIRGPVTQAFTYLKDLWMEIWDSLVAEVKKEGNQIIRGVLIIKAGIQAAIQDLPGVFKAAFWTATAEALAALYDLGGKFEKFMGGIASTMNDVFGTSFDANPVYDWVSSLEVARFEAQKLADAAAANSEAWQEFQAKMAEIRSTDYMGQFFDDIRDQAIQNALGRIEEGMEDVGGAAKRAAKEVKEAVDEMADALKEAADNLAEVFGNAFERLAETGKFTFSDLIKDLNQLIIKSTSELLQQELSRIFQTLATSRGGMGSPLANLFTGLFGGGLPGRARGGVEMPWRNFIAGEEGAELISQDGPSGARRVKTAGQTRHMLQGGRSSGPNITMIVQTPDVDSFKQSQSQLAARMGMFISRGQRNQ